MIAKTKAYYSIAEIAAQTGFSRWQVRRILDRLRIQYIRSGNRIYVANGVLRDAFYRIIH